MPPADAPTPAIRKGGTSLRPLPPVCSPGGRGANPVDRLATLFSTRAPLPDVLPVGFVEAAGRSCPLGDFRWRVFLPELWVRARGAMSSHRYHRPVADPPKRRPAWP